MRRGYFDLSAVWTSGLRVKGGKREKTYTSLHARCSVNRLTEFYTANIVIPMGFFSGLTIFCSFCVARYDVGDRLSVSLTLMLTAAAYKLVITSMMPTIACQRRQRPTPQSACRTHDPTAPSPESRGLQI